MSPPDEQPDSPAKLREDRPLATDDLVLINPNYAKVAHTSHFILQRYPPLGLAYLAAYQRQKGCRVSIIDAHAEELGTVEIIDRLAANRPGWAGVYLNSFSLPIAKELVHSIRQDVGCKIVLGGPHVTYWPQCLETLHADFAIAGDGERSLWALLAGEDPAAIPGLVYHQGGTLCRNAPQPIKDLDSLPFPARDLLPEQAYFSPFRGGRITTMITSRGCPFDCIFCGLPTKGGYYRRSNENILGELAELVERGIDYVEIQDDLFTGNQQQTRDLCEGMLSAGLNVEWGCETRADMVDRETLAMMRRAGCTNIKFGVESGVERIRHELVGKKIPDAVIEQAVRESNRAGMETSTYFVFGFPGETVEDMQRTVDFAVRLKCHYAEFHIAMPIPGSRLFELAVREGIVLPSVWVCAENHVGHPSYVPAGIPLEYVQSLRNKAYRRFYLNPVRILRIAWASKRPSQFPPKWRATRKLLLEIFPSKKRS